MKDPGIMQSEAVVHSLCGLPYNKPEALDFYKVTDFSKNHEAPTSCIQSILSPYRIEIFREPHVPLGISIVGGHTIIKRLKNGEELKGIFIKQVLEESPAGKTKALKTGDKILEVSSEFFKSL